MSRQLDEGTDLNAQNMPVTFVDGISCFYEQISSYVYIRLIVLIYKIEIWPRKQKRTCMTASPF